MGRTKGLLSSTGIGVFVMAEIWSLSDLRTLPERGSTNKNRREKNGKIKHTVKCRKKPKNLNL